jgi:hypothetical protein
MQTITDPKNSNVKRIEYDISTRKLTIHFKNAITYLYTGFPPRAWHRLFTARNIGNWVQDHVIGVYRGRRLRFVPAA